MSDKARVVVVGGGIAGLACAHRLVSLGVDAVLLEAGPRLGGKIETLVSHGVQFEAGPNTLIANRRAMLELIREIGLEPEIVEGAPAAKNRWIYTDDRLLPLPKTPLAALTSPLLGPAGVARALGDLIGRTDPKALPDESVASFIRRRFGKRVLDNLVGPFLSGVYAGDADALEARSVLPTLVEAEAARGSVIRGLIAARRAERRAGLPPLPSRSITFRDGLESLPRRIGQALGERVRLGTPVRAIRPEDSGCRVLTSAGEAVLCDRVVIATPGPVAAALIADLPGGDALAGALRAERCAGLAVVGMLYDRAAIPHPLDGFGYVNGPGHAGPVLGCLFRSSVFPHAAPSGAALIAAFVGGVRHPGSCSMSDANLVAAVRQELAAAIGAGSEPRHVFIRRWPGAIPQYERGHAAVRARVEAWSRSGPVSIVGSALTGVSLNDCVTAGRAEAQRLAPLLSANEEGIPCLSA